MKRPALHVDINWGRLHRIGRVLDDYGDPWKDYGLYQVLGPHILYGNRVLLYLGKTFDSFSTRVDQHLRGKAIGRYIRDYGNDWSDFRLRLGRVSVLSGRRVVSDSLLEMTESAMIRHYQPALNTRNLRSYNDRPIEITNSGVLGELKPNIIVPRDRN